jgi:hypothetical protein
MIRTLPLLLLLLSSAMFAQTTHTFTFGPLGGGCSAFQLLDGQPSDQASGYSGEVCIPYGENPWWGLEVPQVWGFPNNGFLLNNNVQSSLGAPVFVNPACTLRTAGCVFYQTASSAFENYGAGVTVNVTAWFVVRKHSRIGKGCSPCVWYTDDSVDVSGTAAF